MTLVEMSLGNHNVTEFTTVHHAAPDDILSMNKLNSMLKQKILTMILVYRRLHVQIIDTKLCRFSGHAIYYNGNILCQLSRDQAEVIGKISSKQILNFNHCAGCVINGTAKPFAQRIM